MKVRFHIPDTEATRATNGAKVEERIFTKDGGLLAGKGRDSRECWREDKY